MHEEKEQENFDEEYDEQKKEERRKQGRARAWKESKEILMIVIPLLIIVYIGMKIFFNYLVEKHQQEQAEAQKIEQKLKAD